MAGTYFASHIFLNLTETVFQRTSTSQALKMRAVRLMIAKRTMKEVRRIHYIYSVFHVKLAAEVLC